MGGRSAKQNILESLAKFDVSPDIALVDQRVVEALFACSAATVWRRVKSGDIPKPVTICGSTRWRVGDVRKALQNIG